MSEERKLVMAIFYQALAQKKTNDPLMDSELNSVLTVINSLDEFCCKRIDGSCGQCDKKV